MNVTMPTGLEANQNGQSSPIIGAYMMLSPSDMINLMLSKRSCTIHFGSISSKVSGFIQNRYNSPNGYNT